MEEKLTNCQNDICIKSNLSNRGHSWTTRNYIGESLHSISKALDKQFSNRNHSLVLEFNLINIFILGELILDWLFIWKKYFNLELHSTSWQWIFDMWSKSMLNQKLYCSLFSWVHTWIWIPLKIKLRWNKLIIDRYPSNFGSK